MEPSKKSAGMEQILEKMYKRTTSIKSNCCIPPPIGCGKPISPFKDKISEKEYSISGLCQECQDKIFGK